LPSTEINILELEKIAKEDQVEDYAKEKRCLWKRS